MANLKSITRRTFLVSSITVAGGVAFGTYQYKKPTHNPLLDDLSDSEAAITPFVKIDQQGVTLITPRADKGQGAYSIQSMLLAEELDVDPYAVKLSPGKPSLAYYNGVVMEEGAPGFGDIIGKLMGMQITGGSSTVPDMFWRLRYAGAVARETLKKAASIEHNVSMDELTTNDGQVLLPDGTAISYASLAPLAATLKPEKHVDLRPSSQWRYLGKPHRRHDIIFKSTGTQDYGIDIQLNGMLYATVRTNPGLGGSIESWNDDQAKSLPGVKKIVPIRHGVAVIADNTWRAFKAVSALRIVWGKAPYPENSDVMWQVLEEHISPEFQNVQRRKEGDTETSLANREVIDAEYRLPYLAHAPMEPMNATALLKEDRLDVWTGTQIPRFIENHLSELTGLPTENIHIHAQVMGGSFGRRLEDTYVIQAVEIAQSMPNTPIKMTWSREEDMTHDYPRPMTLAKARGTVNNGNVETLDLQLASASLIASWMGRLSAAPPGPDATITIGADDQPYAIPNYRVTGYKAPEMVPISSWRSVAASQNGFYHECFLDELIHKAGADPLQERLRLCNSDLAKTVLETVGELSQWQGSRPPSHNDPHNNEPHKRGRGVALVYSFGVPCAQVVDVINTPDGIRIDHVYLVADVGQVLDPINLEAQLFGGCIWGLGHAMNCELTYKNFAPEQTNYHAFEGMRLHQTPRFTIKALENGDQIRGAGEPAVPPAAPALANAIFAATGQRIRQLPLHHHINFV